VTDSHDSTDQIKEVELQREFDFAHDLGLLPIPCERPHLLTDDLRQKVQPINTAARQILKDRDDRAKIAKRDRKVGDFQTEEIP
jgi:hypothetical protein